MLYEVITGIEMGMEPSGSDHAVIRNEFDGAAYWEYRDSFFCNTKYVGGERTSYHKRGHWYIQWFVQDSLYRMQLLHAVPTEYQYSRMFRFLQFFLLNEVVGRDEPVYAEHRGDDWEACISQFLYKMWKVWKTLSSEH